MHFHHVKKEEHYLKVKKKTHTGTRQTHGTHNLHVALLKTQLRYSPHTGVLAVLVNEVKNHILITSHALALANPND